ncbi:hypothetical protein EX30DRAFT_160234 [Ascodesmis nigricans]|uniref:Uncharacterized protein n=1 Tax=Ascodesmis nigricans TaxID=341454 RepID=A0A4S2MMX1_9PEZI|nr:hypothetical protein EX30DRAFT_160234 [Ascodesmis nigricans]
MKGIDQGNAGRATELARKVGGGVFRWVSSLLAAGAGWWWDHGATRNQVGQQLKSQKDVKSGGQRGDEELKDGGEDGRGGPDERKADGEEAEGQQRDCA